MISMLIASFQALPTWKKALMIGALLMIWPWIAFIALFVALSSIPIFLFGRWEGDLGERPILDEAEHLLQRHRARTAKAYGPTHVHAHA